MGQVTVLVIHSSAALREQIKFVLGGGEYRIMQAVDFGQGLGFLRFRPVDLLICETEVPNFVSVPTILLRECRKGDSKLQRVYLPRPFSSDGLNVAVRRALGDMVSPFT
ncbi:MAG TPA: hypothetical protein ENN41_08130 [Sediminispirochaeta sp.]|nr:hypothetical protein [Sediminispirochaeta sp.]